MDPWCHTFTLFFIVFAVIGHLKTASVDFFKASQAAGPHFDSCEALADRIPSEPREGISG